MALPPTSHICQFGLEETSSRPSCEQPAATCFQQPPPVFRYQHFWSNQGVWKKYRVYHHFSPGQCGSIFSLAWRKPFQTHRCWHVASHNPTEPSFDTSSTSTSLCRCFHPSSPFCRCQHFWFNQGIWKNQGLSWFSPGQCVSNCF